MPVDISALLRQHFGFDEFRPGQREVIDHLLAGRSALAVFPTGGGKSLCYQLPALTLPGLTLVVSPLIALMKDQIDALTARKIPAARLDSTLTVDEYRNVMEGVRSRRLRMLYVAPERFANERFRQALLRIDVSLFAVDEAHCISEWGHNFRPDYLKLAEFAKLCRAERVLALTATATPKVLDDVCRLFEIAPDCAIRTGFYRPNLTVLTTPAVDGDRVKLLVRRLRERPAGPTIVYVTLQRTAEEVAEQLASAGFPARPYHAGMEDDQRAAVQDWFMSSNCAVVVATIAFGMGIDKSDIRYVYHYNLPKSLENFSQEIGRAGRDGEPSTCEMFVSLDDLNVLESFVFGDTPTPQAVRDFVGAVFSLGETFDVGFHEIASDHDIRPLVVRTLLTYLELDGYLQGGTPTFSSYQFQPLMPSADILARFEGERREFLRTVFCQAKKAKTWFHIDLDRAAQAAKSPRDRVVRALDYLGEQKLLEVRTAGVRYHYRRLRNPAKLSELSESLIRRTRERESRELARLHQVVDLAMKDACQVSALSEHFGEPLPQPCGHCSWCLSNHTPLTAPDRMPPLIDDATWADALRVRRSSPRELSDARCFARFLCGVSSPALSRAKLTSHPLFGSLSHVPFQVLLERAGNETAAN